MSQQEIAEEAGLEDGNSSVYRDIALLGLPPEVQELLRRRSIFMEQRKTCLPAGRAQSKQLKSLLCPLCAPRCLNLILSPPFGLM